MGNDNYKQGSDFFMTFSGKKEKSILDFPTKSLQKLSNKKSPKNPYSIIILTQRYKPYSITITPRSKKEK